MAMLPTSSPHCPPYCPPNCPVPAEVGDALCDGRDAPTDCIAQALAVAVVVPTLNASPFLDRLIPALSRLDPAPAEILILDSQSDDDTAQRCRAAGFRVHVIARAAFGHGRTRNLAARLVEADVLVFMTQDAVPLDTRLLAHLLAPFNDPRVGHAFARQVPHAYATPAAAFARSFNYPVLSRVVAWRDVPSLGIGAFFTSNACAAYRRSTFLELNGFPEDVPVSEDTLFAAKMLRAGHALCYVAEARVAHSHNYSLHQELRRYFDIGVAHARAPWYRALAGNLEGRGRAFVVTELRDLWASGRSLLIPGAIMRNAVRWVGYRTGRHYRLLPRPLRRCLSAQPQFWARTRGWRRAGVERPSQPWV